MERFRSVIIFFAAAAVGCGPNQAILESANSRSTPAVNNTQQQSPAATFETDIAAMRTADFDYIYVLRRRDGGVMNADDKKAVNDNTPLEINRKKLSDEGRAIIIGSNYKISPELLKIWTDRFDVTNLSKPENEIKDATAAPAAN